ncbi:hypothetical protein GCM10010359_60090 [Streptomyces morookaense]|nr:hypothetical protein GCM10010359_60090 [Streptomyces morookaense]
MDKAESRAKAFGSYAPFSLAYHVSQVRYGLGDKAGAIESLKESDRHRDCPGSGAARFASWGASAHAVKPHIEDGPAPLRGAGPTPYAYRRNSRRASDR